jgi:hypothetical protein
MQFDRDLSKYEKEARRRDQLVNPIRKPKRSVETVLETVFENLS